MRTSSTLAPERQRPRASRKDDLLTMLFGAWLVIGIFLDGYAHNNNKPESFFTPWHGLFYSGFAACAAWMGWQALRHRRAGRQGGAAVPVGYGLGMVGVVVFALGGAADMVWHQIFGIEVGLEALLSPSHLALFVGATLVLTSPLRSAWADPSCQSPTFRQLLPALLSATLTTAGVAFFFMAFSPWLTDAAQADTYRFISQRVAPSLRDWFAEEVQLEGFAAILLTTVILMAPTLLLLRRWRLPFGSLTLLFGTVTALSAGIEGFDTGLTFLAGVIGGVAGDLLVRALDPSPRRPAALRAFAFTVPVALWLAYFGLLAAEFSVGWSVELWSGITVMSGLAGVGLSMLIVPPALPEVAAVTESPVPTASGARPPVPSATPVG